MSIWSSIWSGVKNVASSLLGGSSNSSSIGTLLGSTGSSALSYYLTKEGMNQQYQYNSQLMEQQYGYNSALASQNYEYNLALQENQNAYSTEMSNTAHQREVADLRAAGLNPILSATGGNGATTPTAGSASVNTSGTSGSSVSQPNYASALEAMFALKRLDNETKQSNALIDKISAEADKVRKEARNLDSTKEGYLSRGENFVKNVYAELKKPGVIETIKNRLYGGINVSSAKAYSKTRDFVNSIVKRLPNSFKDTAKFIYSNKLYPHQNYGSNYKSKSNVITGYKGVKYYDIDDYIRKKYHVN